MSHRRNRLTAHEGSPLLESTPSLGNYTQATSAASTRVRITAVCPDIHCPSCISHLSSFVGSFQLAPAAEIKIEHNSVSLISRSVELDIALNDDVGHSSTSTTAVLVSIQKRGGVARQRLLAILKRLAAALSQEGYPVDYLKVAALDVGSNRSRMSSGGLEMALDASDLYGHDDEHPLSASLPNQLQAGSKVSRRPEPVHSKSFAPRWTGSIAGALQPWTGQLPSRVDGDDQHQRWLKHIEVCKSCRNPSHVDLPAVQQYSDEAGTAATPASDRTTSSPASTDGTQIDAPRERRVRAKLSVGGMSCASCVQAIDSAVVSLQRSSDFPSDSLDAFEVSLLSHSATFRGTPRALELVREAVEDTGFDAEVVETSPIEAESSQLRKALDKPSDSNAANLFRATLSIKGMTCASCVNSINGAIESWRKEKSESGSKGDAVDNFKVNLLEGSASLDVTADKDDARNILDDFVEAIEDCGFDVDVVGWTSEAKSGSKAAAAGSDSQPRRSVRIKVSGMFCKHCVLKIQHHLSEKQSEHPDALELDDDSLERLSLDKPFVDLSYYSNATSQVSLRALLREINGLDPAFSAEYAPPPSLTSRSAALAERELNRLKARLAVCSLFVIPTLLISMIAPLLLSTSHPLNRVLNRFVLGSASLGEILMFAIATPVQFGIGAVFFKRSAKSLAAVWRPGRSWTDRFLRFGNMDVLVALGTLVAYISSFVVLIVDVATDPRGSTGEAEMRMTYFEVSVFLIFFILLGRIMEASSKKKTGDAISELGKLRPTSAQLILDPARPKQSRVEKIGVDLLEVGDLVLVPSGASPPLDGEVVGNESSTAHFDESSLSGESRPVSKADGDATYAGTINVGSSPVICRVRCLPNQTMIDEIVDVVREASGRKASLEQLAETITGIFVPCIVYLALLVLIVWTVVLYGGFVSQDWIAVNVPNYTQPGARFLFGLQFAISCLLVSCPCGIGLAAPTAQLCGLGVASQQGILVNGGGEAFSSASRAAKGAQRLVVVFDKTGTITKGEAGKVVGSALTASDASDMDGDVSQRAILQCVEQAEQGSSHPLAVALRAYCTNELQVESDNDRKAGPSPKLDEVREEAGHGMRASFSRRLQGADGAEQVHRFEVLIGNRKLLGPDCSVPEHIIAKLEEWQRGASTVVFVATRHLTQPSGADQRGTTILRGAFAISDTIRPEAGWTISHLQQRYKADIWMVSGDNEQTAHAVASQVGIRPERVVAGVLPTGKKEWVEKLQGVLDVEGGRLSGETGERRRTTVCFIGDGINDSPAIATSDLGVALGSGSSIAHSSADFILLQRHAPLLSLVTLLELSRATDFKVRSNFAWAFVFNAVLIPLAAGVGLPLGLTLGPELSGIAMALSSTLVVSNSVALRAWRVPKAVRIAAERIN